MRVLSCAFSALALVLLIGPGAEAPNASRCLIVTLRSGEAPESVAREVTTRWGGRVRHVYRAAVRGFAADLPRSAADALARDPRVLSVEPDRPVCLAASGNQLAPTWGLDRVDQRDLPRDLNYAWGASGEGVRVYVLDTGVRISHQEFGGRASHGFDFIDNDAVAEDAHGHGTHVAGTVAGTTYGVAKDAQIVAVRVLGADGQGSVAGVIAGVDWVTQNAVKPAVANMSLGGPVSPTLDSAVRASIASGVTYCVAAGNGTALGYGVLLLGTAQDACLQSPGRVAEAITVGATDQFDREAPFSNFGTCVDLLAPGVDIVSAWYTSDTATATSSGTSMATPHVAGACALYLEDAPTAAPAAVANAVLSTASPGRVVLNNLTSPNLLLYTADLPAGGGPPTAPAVILAETGGQTVVTEGGTGDSYTLVLATQPTNDVVVATAPDAQVNATPTSLLFTQANWNAPQTVDVVAQDDSTPEGDHTGLVDHTVTSSDANYNGLGAPTLTVQVQDNDVPGVLVEESGGFSAVTEGGADDTFTVRLSQAPQSDVTVSITGDAEVRASPGSVAFTTTDWNQARTITATAVVDGEVEGSHTGVITLQSASADAAFQGLQRQVQVTVHDGGAANATSSGGGGGGGGCALRAHSAPGAGALVLLLLMALGRARAHAERRLSA